MVGFDDETEEFDFIDVKMAFLRLQIYIDFVPVVAEGLVASVYDVSSGLWRI